MPSRTRLGSRVIVGPLHFFVGWGHRSALRTVGPDQNVETGETVLDVKRSGRSFGDRPGFVLRGLSQRQFPLARGLR